MCVWTTTASVVSRVTSTDSSPISFGAGPAARCSICRTHSPWFLSSGWNSSASKMSKWTNPDAPVHRQDPVGGTQRLRAGRAPGHLPPSETRQGVLRLLIGDERQGADPRGRSRAGPPCCREAQLDSPASYRSTEENLTRGKL